MTSKALMVAWMMIRKEKSLSLYTYLNLKLMTWCDEDDNDAWAKEREWESCRVKTALFSLGRVW